MVLTTSPAAVLLRFEEYHPRTQSRGDHLILKRAERTAEVILRRRFARQAAAFQRGWTSHKAVINRHTQAFADLPDDVQRVVELSFDSSVTDDEALQLTAAMVRAGQAGVRAAAADADSTVDPERYRLVARQAVRWLRNHVNELFRSVDDTTKQRIGRTLAAGLRDGDHLDALSARVTRTLGEGGWRARMIAQTETMNAYSRSAEETAAGLGVQQMQWLDGQLGACPVCVSLHEAVKTLGPGAVYRGIDGAERARPPAHPACRCVQIAYYEDLNAQSPMAKTRALGFSGVVFGASVPVTETQKAEVEARIAKNVSEWDQETQDAVIGTTVTDGDEIRRENPSQQTGDASGIARGEHGGNSHLWLRYEVMTNQSYEPEHLDVPWVDWVVHHEMAHAFVWNRTVRAIPFEERSSYTSGASGGEVHRGYASSLTRKWMQDNISNQAYAEMKRVSDYARTMNREEAFAEAVALYRTTGKVPGPLTARVFKRLGIAP